MANGNRWSRIGEAGSKLGEALMQVAMMTENRMYRASMLARQGTLDRMALERIRNDEERLRQNALQAHSTWIGQGWTGTPGTEVWTPGQLPADPVVDPTVIGDDLLGRQAAEANPLAQSAMGGMGADLGATYPDPSPIAMGGDPSQFGAELMQTPQFGSGVAGGSFEPARYDPRRSTEYQDRVALNELAAQQPPTYGVSGGTPNVTGLRTEEAATGFASRNAPGATFGIGAGGEVTATNVGREDIGGILQQFYTFDPSAPPSPARQASFALIDTMSENVVTPDTREWLESLDDETVANFAANAEEERRAGLAPSESDRRAAGTVDRVLVGYERLQRIASEISGAPMGSVVGSNVITRALSGPETEQWRSAAIMVVGGTLRWTSGAAIGESEIANLSAALVPQENEAASTAIFKMQALEAQIGAMVRSASLASGRDYGERWENVGIDRLRPTVDEDTRIEQLLAEVVPGQPDGWTDNQVDWFLTMEGYE